MPVLDGKSADIIVKGALGLLAILIIAITGIIIAGQNVPDEFTYLVTSLVSGLLGFLSGSRVVTPDVSAQIKTEPLSPIERQSLIASQERKHD
jgi:hypothetical protein